jgi:hypothetical protein
MILDKFWLKLPRKFGKLKINSPVDKSLHCTVEFLLGLNIIVLVAIPEPGFSQTKASVWERVLPSDVSNSDNWTLRKADKALNLTVLGDFDGDGRQDEAYLAKNVSAKKYAVFVKMAKAGARPLRLDTGKLSDLPSIGVSAVKPGRYTDWCARKSPRPDKCVPIVEVPNQAVSVFMYESAARIIYYKNGEWLTIWTSD